MDAAEYARPNGRDASIGQHVRHLLDHYETLLRCEDPRVDHTIRAREELVANCRRTALDRVRTVQGRRDQWADRRGPFRGDPDGSGGESGVGGVMEVVYLPDGPESDPAAYRVRSTLERELLFVLSHTIHQMALIAILARHGGMPVPDGFGVASSTKRQRR